MNFRFGSRSYLKESLATPDYYRKLFAYNEKVLRSYLRSIGKLPWKKASENMEASHDSIKNIFVHILTVYNGWLNYNIYGKSSEIPHDTEHNPDNYNSIRDVQKFMEKVWKGVHKLMEDLDEDLLSKRVKAPWLPGSHALRDVLMQITLEQAHHLGEIIALFWQMNVEPPEMTWIMNTRNFK
ncbi:MAG: DinB family protein [Thaumarchaeota archaeon]|nr:DinB family protein [Nitrososphaerota archaeon]